MALDCWRLCTRKCFNWTTSKRRNITCFVYNGAAFCRNALWSHYVCVTQYGLGYSDFQVLSMTWFTDPVQCCRIHGFNELNIIECLKFFAVSRSSTPDPNSGDGNSSSKGSKKGPVPLLPKPEPQQSNQGYALIPLQHGVPVMSSHPIIVSSNWALSRSGQANGNNQGKCHWVC